MLGNRENDILAAFAVLGTSLVLSSCAASETTHH